MSDTRRLAVPDGLEGERVDTAIARVFGVSRTRAADLVVQGRVLVDGDPPAKSDRVTAGAWLEVELPDVVPASSVDAEPVAGLQVIYD
ncbi:MAG TPA: S4 domain-containing protein, partial [Actinomycetes bacterium]|nr:S4 domain-containing protein [Actinomycetes bacterium]